MSTPTSIPSFVADGSGRYADLGVVGAGALWHDTLRAMASTVSVCLGPGSQQPGTLFAQIGDVFSVVEAECTRFDPASDLMRANAAGESWCRVGGYCFAALREACRAYDATAGRFDPRVLQALRRLGYRESMEFRRAAMDVAAPGVPSAAEMVDAWRPQFDAGRRAVQVGPQPIDLGGIGKGLAVRWAAERIDPDTPSFLIDAGGDCYARGAAPEGGPWRIGVEDPLGGDQPLAVVAITDAACVTSSIRLRRWQAGGQAVHHLVDPRTGAPGGAGLLAVTVVGSDPAEAEVWSKVLFLHGRDGIACAADERDDVAVLWVHDDGTVGMNHMMVPLVIWAAGG
jgi:thiamine biosynthesis lipoprotein